MRTAWEAMGHEMPVCNKVTALRTLLPRDAALLIAQSDSRVASLRRAPPGENRTRSCSAVGAQEPSLTSRW